jgi:hypothetical protein
MRRSVASLSKGCWGNWNGPGTPGVRDGGSYFETPPLAGPPEPFSGLSPEQLRQEPAPAR